MKIILVAVACVWALLMVTLGMKFEEASMVHGKDSKEYYGWGKFALVNLVLTWGAIIGVALL
jgi:hypothetical protein